MGAGQCYPEATLQYCINVLLSSVNQLPPTYCKKPGPQRSAIRMVLQAAQTHLAPWGPAHLAVVVLKVAFQVAMTVCAASRPGSASRPCTPASAEEFLKPVHGKASCGTACIKPQACTCSSQLQASLAESCNRG